MKKEIQPPLYNMLKREENKKIISPLLFLFLNPKYLPFGQNVSSLHFFAPFFLLLVKMSELLIIPQKTYINTELSAHN